jgi:hypothetical protein
MHVAPTPAQKPATTLDITHRARAPRGVALPTRTATLAQREKLFKKFLNTESYGAYEGCGCLLVAYASHRIPQLLDTDGSAAETTLLIFVTVDTPRVMTMRREITQNFNAPRTHGSNPYQFDD